MNKRKREIFDKKDMAQSKMKKITIENWLRSSNSNRTLATDDTVEDNISTLKENVDPFDRSTSHKIDDNSSAGSFLPHDIEMQSEEDTDSTLKENVEPSDRLTTNEICDSPAKQTNIENQSDRQSERTTSSTSGTHDESYILPDCFEKIGSGRKNIRCKVCFSQIGLVSVFVNNGKHHIPAICTQTGTQNRKAFVEKHLQSLCHESALKSQRLTSLRPISSYLKAL